VKQTVVAPLGLITQPNKYGQFPPGGMSIATNVLMRDPGVLSSMPDLQTLRSNAMPSGDTARRVWAGTAYQLVMSLQGSTWTMRWVNAAGATTITSPALFSHSFSTGIAPVVRIRDRTIVGTANGPVVMDSETDAAARLAGLGASILYMSNEGAGIAVSNGQTVAYAVVFRRKFSDGYEINGPFSERRIYVNDSGATRSPTLSVPLESEMRIEAGDLCELYKTYEKPNGVDPGATLYLVKTATVTSAHLTAGVLSIVDDVPEANMGAEAYVNPGQGSPTENKFGPPIARDIVTHKGHTLYLGTTARASLTAYVSGTMADPPLAPSTPERATGLGLRQVTGNVTNGSPIITAVSAADMIGIAVGQGVGGNPWFATTVYVTAVGVNTITVSGNATATVAATTVGFLDMMTVDGFRREVGPYAFLAMSLTAPTFWSAAGLGTFGLTVLSNASAFDVRADEAESSGSLSGFTMAISRMNPHEGSFTIQASNGQNYQPPIATYSQAAQTVPVDQRLNRVHWAEAEQPEAVPLLNSFFVGNGELYRGFSVGGVVLIFASDGLWQLTGDGTNGWALEQLDPTLILASRGAAGVMDGLVHAYTNRGLVLVSPSGVVTEVSSGKIGQASASGEFAGASYADTWSTYVVCDELHHETLVTLNGGDTFTVFNSRSGRFTTLQPTNDATAASYSRALSSIVFATATSGGPSVEYFRADSSTVRMAGAIVRFQPLVFGDPTTSKEWSDVEYIFEGFATAGALVPSFGGVNYNTRVVPAFPANSNESRCMVGVPVNAPSFSNRLIPGFTFSSGATENAWSLRGFSVTIAAALELGSVR